LKQVKGDKGEMGLFSWLKRSISPTPMTTSFPGVRENKNGTIDFSLTDEEASAVEIALQSFKDYTFHHEIAERMHNGIFAVALCRHAKWLVETQCAVNSKAEYKSKLPIIRDVLSRAIAAVWKSYSLYQLPIFLYHRAVFFEMLGDKDRSWPLFKLFLKKQSEFKMDQVDKSLKDYEGTDIAHALSLAKEKINPIQ
jgi:hypothetical protein